jgi:hypothetical protein
LSSIERAVSHPLIAPDQARDALKRFAAGEPPREIALSYDVDHSAIHFGGQGRFSNRTGALAAPGLAVFLIDVGLRFTGGVAASPGPVQTGRRRGIAARAATFSESCRR